MQSPSVPPPPDPAKVAAAQAAANKETALTQAQLNATNQVTPYGNLTYTSVMGPNGVPQYTATQTLSPQEQALFNLNQQTRQNVGQIGVDQSARLGTLLGTPVDLSPSAVSGYLTDLGNARLQPILDQQWKATESDLMNRGIMPGSAQYQLAQDAFNRQRNDAYNQLILGGFQQGVGDILAQRNQPINETTALLSGSQVQNPNYVNTPQTGVANTDVAGITNSAYQNQLAAAGLQNQYNQSLMGGLFGLGGTLGAAAIKYGLPFSDRRLKEDIAQIGKTDKGTPIYSFRYLGSPQTTVGFMADDIEKIVPSAVHEINGFKAVDYAAALAGGA